MSINEFIKKSIWLWISLHVPYPHRTLLSGLRRNAGRPVTAAGGGLRMSVQYQPLVLYVIFVVLLEIILRTASGKRKRPMDREKRYRIFILTGVVLVAANWIFKNYMLVFRGVDLLPLMK